MENGRLSNKSINLRLYQEVCRSNWPVGKFEHGTEKRQSRRKRVAGAGSLDLCRAASTEVHATILSK